MRHRVLIVGGLIALFGSSAIQAKDIVVQVDARSGPWRTGINPKLAYGLSNAKPPTVVMDCFLRPAVKLRISATGGTSTAANSMRFGPEGQAEWTADHGSAFFPSHYMSTKAQPIHLNELVGAFIDADGKVVGRPFPIGATTEIEVPDGAAALSMGINDDNYADNAGTLSVRVSIPEPRVTVETAGGVN